jgi:hypothetical protein
MLSFEAFRSLGCTQEFTAGSSVFDDSCACTLLRSGGIQTKRMHLLLHREQLLMHFADLLCLLLVLML